MFKETPLIFEKDKNTDKYLDAPKTDVPDLELSRYLPSKENKSQLFKLLSKKPLIPTSKEILYNNSSRSAKLRYAVRNNNSFFYPSEFTKKYQNYFNLEGRY